MPEFFRDLRLMNEISYNDFEKIEMRIGTIVEVSEFPKARNPSYKINIDLGDLGIKRSSAQITDLYGHEDLLGKQVVAVCNFPSKQIADFMSECLILGVVGEEKGVVLLGVEQRVSNGLRIG